MVNPLLEPNEIVVKRRRVATGVRRDLIDAQTGEVTHAATVHTIEEKDDAEFVKVFAAGVQAIYELTKTGHKAFQAILEVYQAEPMSGGFSDSVYLSWFGNGLSGRDLAMSEKTFQRGLKELLSKGFLAPRSENLFWVNPSLFFKGDRVAFIREYRRRKPTGDAADRQTLEAKGQTRLIP
jgi:hypothetical protein